MPRAEEVFLQSLRDDDGRKLAFRAMLAAISSDSDFGDLAALIGYPLASQLCLYFGGTTIKIPQTSELANAVNAAGLLVRVTRGEMSLEEVEETTGFPAAKLKPILETLLKYYENVDNNRAAVAARIAYAKASYQE